MKFLVDVQVLSIVMSVSKMAITTTLFQRFKSQKIAGKCYPWFKPYKCDYDPSLDINSRERTSIFHPQKPNEGIDTDGVTLRQPEGTKFDSRTLGRRRSSDFYEKPATSHYLESSASELNRETSVVDGPKRQIFKNPEGSDEMDFFPRRLLEIKGLPEDDVMGKTVSFLWWFCFLMARMLAISSFSYFYRTQIFWLLSSHFFLVVALLLYDVRADEVRRAKAIFFIFIGFVYIFCLIEFKIKFKKPVFIYNGFFFLMFLENFVMTLWWYFGIEDVLENWWFSYIFYMILGCSIMSVSSMLFYVKILKPSKVVVNVIPQTFG